MTVTETVTHGGTECPDSSLHEKHREVLVVDINHVQMGRGLRQHRRRNRRDTYGDKL